MNYYLKINHIEFELKSDFNEEELNKAIMILRDSLISVSDVSVNAVFSINIEDTGGRNNLEKLAKKFKLNGEE